MHSLFSALCEYVLFFFVCVCVCRYRMLLVWWVFLFEMHFMGQCKWILWFVIRTKVFIHEQLNLCNFSYINTMQTYSHQNPHKQTLANTPAHRHTSTHALFYCYRLLYFGDGDYYDDIPRYAPWHHTQRTISEPQVQPDWISTTISLISLFISYIHSTIWPFIFNN